MTSLDPDGSPNRLPNHPISSPELVGEHRHPKHILKARTLEHSAPKAPFFAETELPMDSVDLVKTDVADQAAVGIADAPERLVRCPAVRFDPTLLVGAQPAGRPADEEGDH